MPLNELRTAVGCWKDAVVAVMAAQGVPVDGAATA